MEMGSENPRLGRLAIAAVLFFSFIGATWYIAYLRAENTRLQSHSVKSGVSGINEEHSDPAARKNGRALSAEQREAMLARLRSVPSGERPVWFATAANDPEANAFRMSLQTVFEEAG